MEENSKEQIQKELISLFEDMLGQLDLFKRATYSGAFKKGYERHKQVIADIEELCGSCSSEEERARVTEELAAVLPDYAKERSDKANRFKRTQLSMDYNLNMAVYVVPMLNYTKAEGCEKVSRRMVELWNEKKASSMELGFSPSYEHIADSFRKGIFGLFRR